MNMPNTAEIIIIGGGVMGASAAYHLAQLGFDNILLVERNEFFGQEATGKCAGGVRYQFATEVNVRLSMESLPMLERFKDEIGQEIDYRQCGYLFVLTNEKDVATFLKNVEMQHRLGIMTEWISGDDIRRRFPYMNFHDAIAGTFHGKDGLVDPNSVVMGYIGAAQKMGVRALSSVEVQGITIQSGKIRSVRTNIGEISAPIVINAAGPWAGVVGKMAGIDIPIIPIRRQIFTTSPIPALPSDFPFIIDFAQSLYFHREGEGILSGMSNPNEKEGFSQNVDSQWELINLDAAIARFPALEKASLVSHWAGLYEVTPDAHPIIGHTQIEGFYIVGGFSGHGFMHGPIAGKLIAEIIQNDQAVSLDISMLDIARFEEGRLIREYNVV